MTHAKLSRRELLTALPVGAMVATTSAAWAEPNPAELSFLTVGDWGRDGASHQTEVARQMGGLHAILIEVVPHRDDEASAYASGGAPHPPRHLRLVGCAIAAPVTDGQKG